MSNPSQLRLRAAGSPEELVGAVVAWLREPRPDPFAGDIVCAPDPGAARWLAQQVALGLGPGGDGVCAGVDFPTVGAFAACLLAAAAGVDRGEDPWRPAALAWTVLDQLEAAHGEAGLSQVWAHLDAATAPPGARMATARRIAGLFDRYARRAPELLETWREGRDVGPGGERLSEFHDGTFSWQPELYRRCRVALASVPDPVERLSLLSDSELAAVSPRRLLITQPGTLPGLHRRLLERLAGLIPIEVVSATPAHDVLAERLGRYGRRAARDWEALAGRADAEGAAGAAEEPSLARGLRIDVHSSHGRDRQVEVLRDCLLSALEEDPTLEPRDIVVFAPSPEAFAPLLDAAFAPDENAVHPGHGIRLRLAARGSSAAAPVLGALVQALDLAGSRAGASELLELLAHPAVARRWGWGPDEFERVAELVRATGVRWGLDPEHRAEFGLAQVPSHTWRSGLDRLALGVALSEDDLISIGGVLPFDDVESDSVELVGALLFVFDRLREFWQECARPRSARAWSLLCEELVTALMASEPDAPWQVGQALGALADVAEDAGPHTAELSLAEFRQLLVERAQGFSGRSSFGTGALLVCRPGELTGVPHRMICLLGFDADAFPRTDFLDGDDLVAGRDPDTEVRARDRQALLTAVRAARERLLIVYGGQDPVTNAVVAPSIPLAEVIAAAPQAIHHRHPLQPFSPSNFQPESGGQVSFDAASLAGARSLTAPALPAPSVNRLGSGSSPLPETVSLAELEQFLKHPARRFLRMRAGLYDAEPEAARPDEFPLGLDHLERWAVGDRLLSLALRGQPLEAAVETERLRGTLPVGALADVELAGLSSSVAEIAEGARGLLAGDTVDHDIMLEVPLPEREGRQPHTVLLTGSVRTVDGAIVDVGFSKLGARQKLAAWLRLLALGTAYPDRWRWVGVGRGSRSGLGPVPPTWNSPGLASLVELYVLGLEEPLPLPILTSEAYARAVLQGRDATDPMFARRLQGVWERDADTTWMRFYPTVSDLLASTPDPRDSRHYTEPSRFGTLARCVWEPLLRVEGGGHEW